MTKKIKTHMRPKLPLYKMKHLDQIIIAYFTYKYLYWLGYSEKIYTIPTLD